MTVRFRKRDEHLFGQRERDALSLEECTQCGIIGDAHHIFGDLNWKVQVSNGPTESGNCSGLGDQCDFEDGLGQLLDCIKRRIARVKHIAMCEWCGEVESKLNAILCDRAPAPFREREPIRAERHNGK